jgi:hypothetical protein
VECVGNRLRLYREIGTASIRQYRDFREERAVWDSIGIARRFSSPSHS